LVVGKARIEVEPQGGTTAVAGDDRLGPNPAALSEALGFAAVG
jgi:hypothetical protein